MSITVKKIRSYHIRSSHGWAEIFIRHGRWRDSYYAYVSIVSDFGNYGYCWTDMGSPHQEFLSEVDFWYAMNKLSNGKFLEFDLDTAIKDLKERIIDYRREESITKDEAREFWDTLESAEYEGMTNETVFYQHMAENDLWYRFDLWECDFRIPNNQAKGLWEHIWPQFVAELQREISNRPFYYRVMKQVSRRWREYVKELKKITEKAKAYLRSSARSI